ncbi:hypothetical protein [Candidatus Karelsulcia muelleri]|uniref:hypothetical protein n=1 Tax=Candidatus Karelsulcia muelleri TaxID=336810 RepID=UPI0013A6455A|nr:hypothetical protein [Candidatus Karelsulcia muelleri]
MFRNNNLKLVHRLICNSLLRIKSFKLLFFSIIPVKVIINEYSTKQSKLKLNK